MNQIETAIQTALAAHTKQVNKGGITYILHPMAVALNFRFEEENFCAAILHDVVEDSDFTIQDLINLGFSKNITDMVEILTRKTDESYQEFIKRIGDSSNSQAIRIKLADIGDNLSRSKSLDSLEQRDYLYKRYRDAETRLGRILHAL